MKKINKYTHRCPSSSNFELYLAGNGNGLFISEFESHIKECQLCNEAIEGYKLMQLTSTPLIKDSYPSAKPHTKFNIKWIGYAASIVIVFGLMFFGNNQIANRSLNENMAFVNTESDYEPQHNKRLNHKSSGEYWYISSEQKIAINDQLISEKQVETATNVSTNRVYVQVESSNNDFNQQVIQTIKSKTSAPVLSYSKTKWGKKN